MGVQMVKAILDDKDGSELPENTEPVSLTYKGQRFSLYLSKANSKELDRIIAEFTKNAGPAKSVLTVNADGITPAMVRKWARSEEGGNILLEEANMDMPAAKGRMDERIWKLYEKHAK